MRGVAKNGISFPRAGVRKLDSFSEDLLSAVSLSVASLQLERRESDPGEEDEQDTGREERVDACEEEEAEEVRNSEEGIHSHVSKSENLE